MRQAMNEVEEEKCKVRSIMELEKAWMSAAGSAASHRDQGPKVRQSKRIGKLIFDE